ncbi:pyruvate dehydrogenase complex dihydrolipoamide acetyltransferase [Phenylobacterium aquaticum]|uniref:pyruvate dehydrogenase complex dihydrolipoamide acetyltransferase n=2 Tax=Phenylobacterium aquaticum TaxID=1763816 RepID=UPI001F5CEEC2|nr:pyruvate dehydrogenase complex dihydrolipoamide acetyltransferase [Phenylobacterium aquaticum]MCI3133546.1 pyruvate dehydrogenase complex dihydrolipoamide acetyltransferase [Phenylobacterium aquaticum]
MSIDVLMPALSPTMEEGTLAKWHVKKGDVVKSGDVIAEIETDKATMEVEAVDEGVVEDVLVPEGTEGVKVNTPIARLVGEGEAAAPASPVPSPLAGEGGPAEQGRMRGLADSAEKPVIEVAAGGAQPLIRPLSERPPSPSRGEGSDGRIFASPLARRIAQQKGLDLSALKGSGPHGRIIKADVESATPGAARPAPAAAGGTTTAATAPRQVLSLAQMGIPDGSYDLIPLDGMRKTVARRLTESFRDVPHFPLTLDLEIDALLAGRVKINALLERQGVKVSVNDLVIKAAAIALRQVPEANASYTPEGIALHHHADIAMAVALDGGLITPIIRAAETKGLAQIATEAKDLAARARARKLKPEEFQGGTFSISNLGMYGIKAFSSIINEPQGAILSVGAGEQRPVVKNGQLAVATVMTVTMTCDHRVVDGAVGARWLAAFKALVEEPLGLIL